MQGSTWPFWAIFILFYSIKTLAVTSVSTHEALGEQQVAIILIENENTERLPFTPEEAFEMIFVAPTSLEAFIKEASYGRTTLKGTVYPWQKIKGTGACPNQDEILQAWATKYGVQTFDRFIFLHSNCSDLFFGFSTHGKEEIVVNGKKLQASVSQVNLGHRLASLENPRKRLANLTGTVLTHEVGHALGIRAHSNLLECYNHVSPQILGDCKQEAIADMFAIMGGEGFFRAALHPSACHKQDIGWLQGQDVVEISVDQLTSPREIVLQAYELAEITHPKALAIILPKPYEVTDKVKIQKLFVEYRTPRGFDADMQEMSKNLEAHYVDMARNSAYYTGTEDINIDGVQLRGGFYFEDHCVTSYLLDPQPESLLSIDSPYSLYDHLDAFLLVGQSFEDKLNGFKLEVLEMGPERRWVKLRVSQWLNQ